MRESLQLNIKSILDDTKIAKGGVRKLCGHWMPRGEAQVSLCRVARGLFSFAVIAGEPRPPKVGRSAEPAGLIYHISYMY